jgi:UDP-N-acetyl-D-glucosamine dehydrogenase
MKRTKTKRATGAQGKRGASAVRGIAAKLNQRIARHTAKIGIIGLGYVGLPLACLFAEKGFPVTGFDIDAKKVDNLNAGRSYIKHIAGKRVGTLVRAGRLAGSTEFRELRKMDAVIICVPTPLTKFREPDMRFVVATAETVAGALRAGQLVVLESSTYPGTTTELLKPILERGGMKSGQDFLLAYSPEREDPGNETYGTASIPKVIGGDGPVALDVAKNLYDGAVVKTVPVSSPEAAEAIKLTENIFRAVNIAMVNELKVIFDAMGIDVWEVIEAAKTKPFGYMPFYPGPGLGGHCIPIDPFYLTWKARAHNINTRFIELAGEINTQMPHYVVARLTEALSRRAGKALRGAKILMLGIAYKKNVDDMRESPALILTELLEELGAVVSYHDPYIPRIGPSREHSELANRRSVPLTPKQIGAADAVVVVTDHDQVDYALVARHARLIVDTRNAFAKAGIRTAKVVKA